MSALGTKTWIKMAWSKGQAQLAVLHWRETELGTATVQKKTKHGSRNSEQPSGFSRVCCAKGGIAEVQACQCQDQPPCSTSSAAWTTNALQCCKAISILSLQNPWIMKLNECASILKDKLVLTLSSVNFLSPKTFGSTTQTGLALHSRAQPGNDIGGHLWI